MSYLAIVTYISEAYDTQYNSDKEVIRLSS